MGDVLLRTMIADILGIPASQIEHEHIWAFHLGHMDEGACCACWLIEYLHAEVTP